MGSAVFHTRGPAGTRRVAEALGRLLSGGELIALCGDLGAGKTAFVQGAARGLEVPKGWYVNSPTFTLINEYPGRLRVQHVDLYRLDDPGELIGIGYDELVQDDAVVFVEWFDRFEESQAPSWLDLRLHNRGIYARRIEVTARGDDPRYPALIERWAASLR